MLNYHVVITDNALNDLSRILREGAVDFGREASRHYVETIQGLCQNLTANPHMYSYDEHTKHPRTHRSFSHKAHKIFYRVNDETGTVFIVTIRKQRMLYDDVK